MAKKKAFYPSMMCADFSNLAEETVQLSATDIAGLHIDIMDGTFVPNFGMSPEDMLAISKNTDQVLDVHLMINHPENYVDLFFALGANRINIHPETTSDPIRVLRQIAEKGLETGVAISPGTSIETVSELLKIADYALIMTVTPGFSGQTYLEFVNDKIKKLQTLKKMYSFKVVADGALSPARIQQLSNIGVDGFILGTSALFQKNLPYSTIIANLHRCQEAEC
ncbi:MAG: ribulose-phosphate 3-epimerase [Sporolactobacillus sp.]